MDEPRDDPPNIFNNKAVLALTGVIIILACFIIYAFSDAPSLSPGPSQGAPDMRTVVSDPSAIAGSPPTKGGLPSWNLWERLKSFVHDLSSNIAAEAVGVVVLAIIALVIYLRRSPKLSTLKEPATTAQSANTSNPARSSSTTRLIDPPIGITLVPRLDYKAIARKLNGAKKGDRFVIQKNWLCASTDALDSDFATALFSALRRGIDVYIFLLHPRSPSARRRAVQLDFRKKSSVSELVITTVRKLQEKYRDRIPSAEEGKLRVFCHDTYSGLELFLLHDTVSDEAWAQMAFYNSLGVSSDYTQLLVETPEQLAVDARDHALKYLRLFTPNDGMLDYYAVAVNLDDPNASERLRNVPLMVEAEDIAFGLTSVSENRIDSFTSDISALAKSVENPVQPQSASYFEVLQMLSEKSIVTDTTASAIGVRSVIKRLTAQLIEKMVKETPDSGQLLILDNWLVGDVGVHELNPCLIDAYNRGIQVSVILLHPNSILADRRLSQVQDERSVRHQIKESIKELVWTKRRWENANIGKSAPLKIYLHDAFTSVQVFVGAETACVGFYLKNKLASAGPQLLLDTASVFGGLLKDHLLSLLSDPMRCSTVEFGVEVDTQIDGKPTIGQLAEIAEILCNLSPCMVHEAAEIIVNHSLRGPIGSGLDKFKLANSDRKFDGPRRKEQLHRLISALVIRLFSETNGPRITGDLQTIVSKFAHLSPPQFKTILGDSKVRVESIKAFLDLLKRLK